MKINKKSNTKSDLIARTTLTVDKSFLNKIRTEALYNSYDLNNFIIKLLKAQMETIETEKQNNAEPETKKDKAFWLEYKKALKKGAGRTLWLCNYDTSELRSMYGVPEDVPEGEVIAFMENLKTE